MPLDRFCLKFATGRSLKMTAKLCRKVPAASAVQERFREVILSKNYGNGNTADNFVSPYTVDFKMQISHTVRLEITATPEAGNFFTATPHKKCAKPQHRKSPMSPFYCDEGRTHEISVEQKPRLTGHNIVISLSCRRRTNFFFLYPFYQDSKRQLGPARRQTAIT